MGKLILIATPIGHLGDLSERARLELSRINTVVAENPSFSRKLMSHLGAGPKKWMTLAAHNERSQTVVRQVLDVLKNEDVAVISDAGSVCISDPGATLVASAYEEGFEVISIPGPSSVISALQLAGYPESRGFSFYGFLNRITVEGVKKNARRSEKWAHIIFLSPHRGAKELADLTKAFPEAHFTVCFELTKMHERCYRGSSSDILQQKEINWQGECVCVFETPASESDLPASSLELIQWLWGLYETKNFPPPKVFAKLIASHLQLSASEIYALRQSNHSKE